MFARAERRADRDGNDAGAGRKNTAERQGRLRPQHDRIAAGGRQRDCNLARIVEAETEVGGASRARDDQRGGRPSVSEDATDLVPRATRLGRHAAEKLEVLAGDLFARFKSLRAYSRSAIDFVLKDGALFWRRKAVRRNLDHRTC